LHYHDKTSNAQLIGHHLTVNS